EHPPISSLRPGPPIAWMRTYAAIASRILWANTKLVLYCTPRSRDIASIDLPLTSLQKTAIASRYALRGSLWNANSVPLVTEKSLRQALQRQRGAPFGRRQEYTIVQ